MNLNRWNLCSNLMFFNTNWLGPETKRFLKTISLKSSPRFILISSMKSGSSLGIVKLSPKSPFSRLVRNNSIDSQMHSLMFSDDLGQILITSAATRLCKNVLKVHFNKLTQFCDGWSIMKSDKTNKYNRPHRDSIQRTFDIFQPLRYKVRNTETIVSWIENSIGSKLNEICEHHRSILCAY